jgi:hypothetical protein
MEASKPKPEVDHGTSQQLRQTRHPPARRVGCGLLLPDWQQPDAVARAALERLDVRACQGTRAVARRAATLCTILQRWLPRAVAAAQRAATVLQRGVSLQRGV